jgi:hypothetical protein
MSELTFPNDDDVLLWGGRAIGAAISKEEKPALRMLEEGKIRCAKKRGGRRTAWRRQLREEFGISDARQSDVIATIEMNGGA